jgi:hypothetical protein
MKEPETYWGDSRTEFNASLEKVLGLARYQIIIYDKNFEDWPLESKDFADRLAASLLRMKEVLGQTQAVTPLARLTMLVQETDWLEKKAPRWARIRRTYPSFIAVRQVPNDLAANDSIAIVDQQHAVIRPHRDSFRAKTIIAQPSEVEARLAKLKQIAELSPVCLPSTTLGL